MAGYQRMGTPPLLFILTRADKEEFDGFSSRLGRIREVARADLLEDKSAFGEVFKSRISSRGWTSSAYPSVSSTISDRPYWSTGDKISVNTETFD